MTTNEKMLKEQLVTITEEVTTAGSLKGGDLLVLGCTTSEVIGGIIGKNSSAEVGQWIASTLIEQLDKKGISLAIRGCEHINRTLAMERRVAGEKGFEIVSAVPQLHAGGSCSVVAFEKFDEPVEVEHIVAQAGVDTGNTSIDMHARHVQVPLRLSIRTLGAAHAIALYSRPKYIGGPRVHYETTQERGRQDFVLFSFL